MEYAVVITKEPDSHWQAVVQGWPDCEAQAETREEVIASVTTRLHERLRHTEVIHIEAPAPALATQAATNGAEYSTFAEEWPDFGIFRDDPTLDALFDEIERRRDEQLARA
jgi:ABC-type nitrate/sulfonate/bicarbonate transport system substrate-binding protein